MTPTWTYRLEGLRAWQSLQYLVPSMIAVVVHVPTLAQPLVEAHAFRQTQTAFAALIYHQRGIDLLHPTVPVLGPPWEMTFEFPLFQAMAALVMDLGSPPEIALRGLSFALFLVTGAVLWRLLRRLSGTAAASVGLFVFYFSPFGLLWSRTSLIEYLATSCALGFVLFALSWREHRGRGTYALAVILGTTAMVVKVTTAAYWVIPFLVFGFASDPKSFNLRLLRSRAALLMVAIPLGFGIAWTAYADSVKAASVGTAWLTSSALAVWNFGTVAQRLDPQSWVVVGARMTLMGGWLLPLAIPLALLRARRDNRLLMVIWLLVAAFAPIATFTNLYVVHDYYLAAISPAIAALIGLGFGGWLDQLPSRRAHLAIAEGIVIWVLTLGLFSPYWGRIYEPVSDPEYVLPRALQIRDQTQPGDLVAINRSAWTPALFYYSGRSGTVVDDGISILPGYVVFRCTPAGDPLATCVRSSPTTP